MAEEYQWYEQKLYEFVTATLSAREALKDKKNRSPGTQSSAPLSKSWIFETVVAG